MSNIIDIDFSEEPSVEIPAVTTSLAEPAEVSKARRHFWLGWQLFKVE